MTNIMFALLVVLASWEEVQQLIQRKSWNKEDFWIPIWETDWRGKFKLFDSHHLAYGLFMLNLIYLLYTKPDIQIIALNFLGDFKDITLIFIYWWIFFYLRNLCIHIIFRKKNRQWKYLSPIQVS